MCQETNPRRITKLGKQGACSTGGNTEYFKTSLQKLQQAPLSQRLPDPLTACGPNALLTSILVFGLIPSQMQKIKAFLCKPADDMS